MNEQQLNQLKQQLLEEKQDITERLKGNENYGMEHAMNASIGELSGYDNHPADLGTELFERGKDLALNEADERHLQEIKTALKRMDEGSYGICKQCGQEIPFARLEAVPTAEYCLEHRPHPHISAKRPVEESRMQLRDLQLDGKDVTFFDREDAWQEVERYGTSNPPDFFVEGHSYNELTVDHNEQRGYIDLVEGFSITDLSGNSEEITEVTHNQAYNQKELEEILRDDDPDFS